MEEMRIRKKSLRARDGIKVNIQSQRRTDGPINNVYYLTFWRSAGGKPSK